MKLQVWEDEEKEWGWSIFNMYGDEIATQTRMLESRIDARQEAYAALSDYPPDFPN